MIKIHPTAIIGKNVNIEENTEIGAYCIIGNNVTIGKNTKIFSHVSIGTDAEYRNTPPHKNAGVIIGENCVIREFVTINNNVTDQKTKIGNDCYLMTKSHIGHDSVLGDFVSVCSSAIVGGHSKINNYCYLGLNSVLHQFSELSEFCLVGAQSFFKGSSAKGLIWVGVPAKAIKVNIIGIERNVKNLEERKKIIEEAQKNLGK